MFPKLLLTATVLFASTAFAQDPTTSSTKPVGSLVQTPQIVAALDAGGVPVVVNVLGVVCDFCAKAMNRTFGGRDDVLAVHVDLDSKTLNLVLQANSSMDDAEIQRLVVRSGYKTKAIHRGPSASGGHDAPDPT